MKIRLDEIGDEPYTWHTEETVDPAVLERDEVVELTPIDWRGRIRRLDQGFLLRARVAYEQTLACQRCLAEVTRTVQEDVELLLVDHEPGAEDEERELEEQDLGVLVMDEPEIDLRPILLEQIQLNVPMRPLCSETCAGLCPVCGADLNEGECGCRRETDDPRWAGLAALRDSLPSGPDGSTE
ncbi:MAG: DUF177 domain-containing protein [Acidobacteriota bacterium]|jgi:uncharacterized protein